jgi:ElaB/YqjD/DUF883 family membrane-anchored ribosome-binding protein
MSDRKDETEQAEVAPSLASAGTVLPAAASPGVVARDETSAVLHQAPEDFTEREPEVQRSHGEGLGAGLKDILETMEQGIKQNWLGVNAAIVDTAGSLSAAVESTVHSAEGAVHDGTEAMDRAFDFPEQVRQNAWLMVGGAVFLGVLLGFWLGRARS